MVFKSIYNHVPREAVISSDSEVKRDESLTISQILSLHLRGISANVHMYDDVKYVDNYNDENEDYYDLENDLSDYNAVVPSSGDFERVQANEQSRDKNAIPNREQAIDESLRGDEVISSETSATL